ncbi:MAG: hypothetical protein EOO01_02550 [Chitinophagaceae bacterium]|nr:MAG: hypothetical protein EOO01_02550 [Chitinophagaceae bacterium]
MNMKHPIVIVASVALSFSAQAQSLEEGVKMYKYERYQTARTMLTPLAATNPNANYYLGLIELNEEKPEAAKAIFSKYPDDVANMSGMARLAFAQKNVAEGNRLAQAVAAKAGKKAWEPLKFAADALNYSEGGNIQQAIDWYKESLKRNDNFDTRIALGDAFQKMPGGGGEAMSNYEHVTGKDPKNSLAFSRIGALWYAAKNYTLALESYQKAKDADPSNPIPFRDLANAYFWVGKYDLSLQNIEKYLELSDKTQEDQVQYLNILYLAKKYPEAIQKAQELIKTGVVKPGFFGIIGYSQLETKDYANALESIRKYFSIQDPSKIKAQDVLRYGRAALSNNLTDSADYYFNKAVAMDTAQNKTEIYRQIAEGFKDAKDYPKAAQWYDKLVKANPETQPLDYFWRGAMHYYAKNYKDATTAFEEMEAKYPDQPSATYWRGRVGAATDEEAKTGAATKPYQQWLEKVGPEYDKKNDLMYAYQYLALYFYNQNDKTNMKVFMDKIEAIDPANSFLKQLKDLMSKPVKTTKS